jgi:hypothetical protein
MQEYYYDNIEHKW